MRGSVLKSPDAFRLSVKRWRRKNPTAYGSLKALKGSRLLRCHSWAKLADDPFGKIEEMNFRGISMNDDNFE